MKTFKQDRKKNHMVTLLVLYQEHDALAEVINKEDPARSEPHNIDRILALETTLNYFKLRIDHHRSIIKSIK